MTSMRNIQIICLMSVAIVGLVFLYMYRKNYTKLDSDINTKEVIRTSISSDPICNIETTRISDPKTSFVMTSLPNSNNIIKIRKEDHNYVKGVLRFDNKAVDMFLHNKHDMISNSILLYGMWESGWIYQMIKYLKDNPGMQLIDAGCNLGVYTLVAASFGHKVIAIDANKNNTNRLAQSVLLNNLTDRVTIILNALSDKRKTFSMNSMPDNIGGQELLENRIKSYSVKSIFLDDVLPIVDRKRNLMMKMDIQWHEIRAMKAASNLFDKTNIKLILIEWYEIKTMPECYTLMSFLLSRNYTAHKDFFSKEELPRSNYLSWPNDVVWRRN